MSGDKRIHFVRKKSLYSFLTGMLLVSPVLAEDADRNWVEVADASATQWHGKKGSGHLVNVDGKKNNAYAYVYQRKDKSKNTFQYGKVFVLLESCGRGYGYVMYNDMEGNFTGKDAFARFGSTVADMLGSMACTGWDSDTGKVSRVDGADSWELAGRSKETGDSFSLKADTVRKRRYNSNPAIAALFSYKNVKNKTTDYSEYVVPLSDCKRGFGTIYELDFDGKVIEKSNFVADGNSVISAMANTLCAKS